MTSYLLHRLASVVLVMGLWFGIGGLGDSVTDSWRQILLATVLLGFTHYIVGGLYQLKSLVRQPQAASLLRWFLFLSAGSLLVFWLCVQLGWLPLLSVALIFYFLLHGYFNEITLFEKHTGYTARPAYVAVVTTWLLGVTCLAVGHASWLFNQSYEYVSYVLYATHVPLLLGVGSGLLLAALALLAWCVWRYADHRWWLLGLLLGLGLLSYLAVELAPLNYVFLLSGLLSYHFIVWFLFYGEAFWRRSRRQFAGYICLHVAVLAPLATVYVQLHPGLWLVNGAVFIPLTIIHISTSFLSEGWFRRWIGVG